MKKYSAANPAYAARPGLKFAFSHPAHALALFFGAGCLRPGPGTWGTAAAVAVWIVLQSFLDWPVLAVLIAALFAVGVWAAEKTSRDMGLEDAGCIVIDEAAAVWLVCLMLPQNPVGWLCAFVSFRIFDIVKLPPASWIDRRLHNGLGVMLDDLFAAVWAVAAVALLDAALNALFPGKALLLGVF